MGNRMHFLDVFARQRYAGNQLAVVEDAETLTDAEMQALAAEIGFSETTFVGGRSADGWAVRIFTPETELPFAGHPTLGTAHVIREQIAEGNPDTVQLDLAVGTVPVDVRRRDGRDTLWMTQQTPTFGATRSHAEVADALSLTRDTLHTEWPVQVVSTGLPALIVPLRSRAALSDIELDHQRAQTITNDVEARTVLAVCQEPRGADNDLAVRVFAPSVGVSEDPATGSANGCLAAYLAYHEVLGTDTVDVRVEQGYEMGRPSRLYLQAWGADEGITVEVGGSVVPVARGNLVGEA